MLNIEGYRELERRRYDNIQIARVLACLGVFICHLASLIGLKGMPGKIANFGASGVYLFFVISGFLAGVSSKTYQSRLSYYKGRALRLLPQYYLIILYEFLLHTLLIRDVQPDPAHLGWLRYIFLLSAYISTPSTFWGNLALTWTVPLFAFFYLLAPWILPHTDRSGQISNPDHIDRNFMWAMSLYPFVLALKYTWMRIGPEGSLSGLYYLHFFALGIVVLQLSRIPRVKAIILYILYIGTIAVLSQILTGEMDYFTRVSWIFAFLLLVTLEIKCNPGSRIQSVTTKIDKYSYDIYLVHGIVFEALTILKPHLPAGPSTMRMLILLMCVLTIIGAVILHALCVRMVKVLDKDKVKNRNKAAC